MQKPLFSVLSFVLLMTIVLSCGKSDVDTPENAGDVWAVTKFVSPYDFTKDQDLFTGYLFEFNDDNVMLIREPNQNIITAKWAVSADQSKYVMNMDNPYDPLSALMGEWEIQEISGSAIKLKGGLGISGNTDSGDTILEFTKQ